MNEDDRDTMFREALSGYADTIDVERDGWISIVDRLDAGGPRRGMTRWVVAGAALAGALAVIVLLLLTGNGSGDGTGEVDFAALADAGTLIAVTDDDHLVELDAAGNERRTIADLAALDLQLGISPGEGRPASPQLALAPDGSVAYMTRSVTHVPGCVGGDTSFSVILAVDLATGSASTVAGRSTTETVDATAPAVAADGTLAYVEELTIGTLPGSCDARSYRVVVQEPGREPRHLNWPIPQEPPTAVDWMADRSTMLVTSTRADATTVRRVSLVDGLPADQSLDLSGPAAADWVPNVGLVLAGTAEWAGFVDQVWLQPSVDPEPGEERSIDELTQPLFDLPSGAVAQGVSASAGAAARDPESIAVPRVAVVVADEDGATSVLIWAGEGEFVTVAGVAAAVWLEPSVG